MAKTMTISVIDPALSSVSVLGSGLEVVDEVIDGLVNGLIDVFCDVVNGLIVVRGGLQVCGTPENEINDGL